MTTRTFKQMGVAFGTEDLEITAKVDNVVVYQGTVVTLNESMPKLPNSSYSVTNELFSWTADVEFSGPQVIEITVGNSAALLVAELTANYTIIPGPTADTYVSSGPDNYVTFRWNQFGNTYINGALQSSQTINHAELTGPWWWKLPAGSEFVENITVNQGSAAANIIPGP